MNPFDGHGLHRMRGDANSGMADAGCDAEQDDTLLCGERRRCHSYSRRQLLANAAIAASRVGSWPWVGVRSSWCPNASVYIPECPTGTAAASMIRPSYRAPSIGST